MSTGAFSTSYDPRRELPVIVASDSINHKLAFTGVASLSPKMSDTTTLIAIFCTKDVYVDFGAAPVAGPGKVFVPGGIYLVLGVKAGQKMSIASADGVSTGTCYLMEGGS